MSYTFKASRISGHGNLIFPNRLIVDENKVTHYKPHLIGHEETNIMRPNMGSVYLRSGILFATIVIETRGGETTRVSGIWKKDAKQIMKLLA